MNRNIKYFLWATFLILILSVGISQEQMKRTVQKKIAKQSIVYEELVELNELLTNTLDSTESEEFVFQQARNRLSMIREHEILVINYKEEGEIEPDSN